MRLRWQMLLAISIALSAGLAFAVRGMVHDVIVVPLSFVVWQLNIRMAAVAEVVRWGVVVVGLALILAWQLVPDIKAGSRRATPRRAAPGAVEAAAVWLARARGSNYFKWQLAHRLGRVSRRVEELAGGKAAVGGPPQRVSAFLDSGLNRSFVDFPARRNVFGPRMETPLDIDPAEVVEYLESQSFIDKGTHANGI